MNGPLNESSVSSVLRRVPISRASSSVTSVAFKDSSKMRVSVVAAGFCLGPTRIRRRRASIPATGVAGPPSTLPPRGRVTATVPTRGRADPDTLLLEACSSGLPGGRVDPSCLLLLRRRAGAEDQEGGIVVDHTHGELA